MNVNKININQSEQTYYIASDIYDVSYHNNGAVFESLSALLGSDNLSTLIPSEIRCGGMTIRFIQSSDNKYVQYRLMAQNFTTNTYDWERYNVTTIPMSQFSANEYYVWSDSLEVGRHVGFNAIKPTSHEALFYNYHLYLRKGDKVDIKGKGTTGRSLLYVLVSVATGNVILMAEKAYDASVTPTELEIDEDCELYGTSLTGSGYYIIIHKNVAENPLIPSNRIVGSLEDNSIPYNKLDSSTIEHFEYAYLLNKKPELNISEGTFTVKADTLIINNRTTSNRQIVLSQDIIFNKPEGGFSGYCVLNISTLEARVIYPNALLLIGDEETVIALVRFNDRVIKGLFIDYLRNGKNVTLIPNIDYKTYTDEQIAGITIDAPAPKMFNPPLNIFKQELRVLDIGNSYTEDSTHYLPNLVEASGIDVSNICHYKAIRGGASYKNWYDTFYDQDTKSYAIYKCFGSLSCDISGTADVGNGEKFRNTLKNNKFDLIIIHQVSVYAPYFDKWEEDSGAGYLSKFIRLIRKYQPQATLGFLLVHSYWSGYAGNTEKSSLERWKKIADSAKKLRLNYGIDFIIPYGTAIQNIRASSLNNEYDLTADGTHCANGLADYTAACTYFQSLIAPRYGISVLGNSARITVEQTENYPSSDISVTDENAPIAQRAAFLACYNMWECQNPENFEDENLI